MDAKKTGKLYLKPILIGAAIFTVLVAHFAVSQFIAFKSETNSTVVELTEKQAAAIEPTIENKAIENKAIENKAAETFVVASPITTSASAKTSAKASAKSAAKAAVAAPVERIERKIEPKRAVEKESIGARKAARETRAERLRRAERILTGI